MSTRALPAGSEPEKCGARCRDTCAGSITKQENCTNRDCAAYTPKVGSWDGKTAKLVAVNQSPSLFAVYIFLMIIIIFKRRKSKEKKKGGLILGYE